MTEFERLRDAGVKTWRDTLRQAAIRIVYSSEAPISVTDLEQQQSKPIGNIIRNDFFISFCERFNIVDRIRSSSKSLSPELKIIKNIMFLSI